MSPRSPVGWRRAEPLTPRPRCRQGRGAVSELMRGNYQRIPPECPGLTIHLEGASTDEVDPAGLPGVARVFILTA